MTLTKYFIIISLLAVVSEAKRKSGCSTATITTEYDEEKKENVTMWICTGYDDTSKEGECFLGSTVIYDKDGYKLSLDEAKTGDVILDGEGKPTKIVGWLHKSSRDKSMIVRIEDYNGGVIEVTHRHLLFDKDDVARFAETFGAGERLSIGDDYITVMDIRTYTAPANWLAPITESGTIRVGLSKVKASCYAEVEHHTLAHYYVKAKHFLSGYDGSRPHFDHKVLGALKWTGLV